MATTIKPLVILDDGVFYVEVDIGEVDIGNALGELAPGFLHRRCYYGVTTPGGYECVGSFRRDARGRWCASIDAPYDPATDSDAHSLGSHVNRLDAVIALWGARHEARCRHLAD